VLSHIEKGLIFGEVLLFAGLLAVYRALPRLAARFGLPSPADWSSLPVLLLCSVLLSTAGEPVVNAFSRHLEHEADVFSLNITQGIVPEPGKAAAESFQIEGESDLEQPDPRPFVVFWLYTHPPVAERLEFAYRYGGTAPPTR